MSGRNLNEYGRYFTSAAGNGSKKNKAPRAQMTPMRVRHSRLNKAGEGRTVVGGYLPERKMAPVRLDAGVLVSAAIPIPAALPKVPSKATSVGEPKTPIAAPAPAPVLEPAAESFLASHWKLIAGIISMAAVAGTAISVPIVLTQNGAGGAGNSTATPTGSPSGSPSSSASSTATISVTPVWTPSYDPSPSLSESSSETSSPSASPSMSMTMSVKISISPSITASASDSASASSSASGSQSSTATLTLSASITRSPSGTLSASLTPLPSPSASASASATTSALPIMSGSVNQNTLTIIQGSNIFVLGPSYGNLQFSDRDSAAGNCTVQIQALSSNANCLVPNGNFSQITAGTYQALFPCDTTQTALQGTPFTIVGGGLCSLKNSYGIRISDQDSHSLNLTFSGRFTTHRMLLRGPDFLEDAASSYSYGSPYEPRVGGTDAASFVTGTATLLLLAYGAYKKGLVGAALKSAASSVTSAIKGVKSLFSSFISTEPVSTDVETPDEGPKK